MGGGGERNIISSWNNSVSHLVHGADTCLTSLVLLLFLSNHHHHHHHHTKHHHHHHHHQQQQQHFMIFTDFYVYKVLDYYHKCNYFCVFLNHITYNKILIVYICIYIYIYVCVCVCVFVCSFIFPAIAFSCILTICMKIYIDCKELIRKTICSSGL